MDAGAAREQCGDGVFVRGEQGGIFWSDAGISENNVAGELLRFDGGYLDDDLRSGNLFGGLGRSVHAGGAYGVDCGKHGDEQRSAHRELDGRERDDATGALIPGADGFGNHGHGGDLRR